MRNDDGLGLCLIESLNKKISKDCIEEKNVVLVNSGSVPENFSGLIIKEDPSHIIIVDAVLMDREPGSIRIIDNEEIANFSFSTHSISLSVFIKYLKSKIDFDIVVIGIQPESMDFGDVISNTVQKTIFKLEKLLINLL